MDITVIDSRGLWEERLRFLLSVWCRQLIPCTMMTEAVGMEGTCHHVFRPPSCCFSTSGNLWHELHLWTLIHSHSRNVVKNTGNHDWKAMKKRKNLIMIHVDERHSFYRGWGEATKFWLANLQSIDLCSSTDQWRKGTFMGRLVVLVMALWWLRLASPRHPSVSSSECVTSCCCFQPRSTVF